MHLVVQATYKNVTPAKWNYVSIQKFRSPTHKPRNLKSQTLITIFDGQTDTKSDR